MNLELILLIIESVLILVTILLLLYNIREGRQRNSLISGVEMATRTLTRLEYFISVSDSMLEAQNEVVACITGRQPNDEADMRRVKTLLVSIEKAINRGVKIRYLLPKFQDRLYIGFLYGKAGAEVYYSTSNIFSNLGYMVVDNKSVIIGIPSVMGNQNVTRKGHCIPSEALASILTSHFNDSLGEAISLEAYAKDVLRETGTSIKSMAVEFGLETKELQLIINKD